VARFFRLGGRESVTCLAISSIFLALIIIYSLVIFYGDSTL
jgi:hypothetical protein